MRTLVYAAGVYAMCMGCAEAFAPQCSGPSCALPSTVGRSAGKRTAGSLRMSGVVDDPADVMARVDALMQGKSIHSVAASFEASYQAPASPEKKWEPYGGYNPATRPRAAPAQSAASTMAEAYQPVQSAPQAKSWSPPRGYVPSGSAPAVDSNAVMARVSEMMSSAPTAAMTNAPAKKWQPYNSNGYVPRGDRPAAPAPAASYAAPAAASYEAPAASFASSGTDPLSNAPAKKWQPYNNNGYVPQGRASAPAAYSAAASYDAPAASFASSGTDPLSNAPAKKWQPYNNNGYVPRGDRPAAPVMAAAPAAASYAAPADSFASSGADPLSNAPAKKWQPYNSNGYVPESQRGGARHAGPSSYSAPAQVAASFASSGTDPLSNAPAKKWQPYNNNGYVPRGDRPAAPVMAASASYAAPASASYAAPTSAASDPLSNAPAKKWQPYNNNGYVPRGDRPAAPVMAAAPAASAPAYAPAYTASSSADPLSSAPAKKWSPPAGYSPRGGAAPAPAPAYTAPAQEYAYSAPAAAAPAASRPSSFYDTSAGYTPRR